VIEFVLPCLNLAISSSSRAGRKSFFERLRREPRYALKVGLIVGVPAFLLIGHNFFAVSEEQEIQMGQQEFEGIVRLYRKAILPVDHPVRVSIFFFLSSFFFLLSRFNSTV
jgi:hypothetical protein